MKELVRTKINDFSIENSITLEELDKLKNNLIDKIISIENVFNKNEKIELSEEKHKLFLNGVKLSQNFKNGLYRTYCNKRFIGLGIMENNLLKRDVII